MEQANISQIVEIFKHLSPQNQAYFMTLLRVAKVAEDNARKEDKTQRQKQ